MKTNENLQEELMKNAEALHFTAIKIELNKCIENGYKSCVVELLTWNEIQELLKLNYSITFSKGQWVIKLTN